MPAAKKRQKKQEYRGILKADTSYNRSLLIGIPTTGNIRMEWHFSQGNIIMPVNWSNTFCSPMFPTNSIMSPMGFHVDHARNICCAVAIRDNVEWMLFIDHDTLVPPDTFVKMSKYIDSMEYPIVSGLYTTRSYPSTPLVFRGRGNGAYNKFKLGDKVPVDGVVMGCTLINMELIYALRDVSEIYNDKEHRLLGMTTGLKVWKIFKTPREAWYDPERMEYKKQGGTEDLYFCDRILNEGIFAKTKSWKHMARKKYPFLTDTTLRCGHIDNKGRVYPAEPWTNFIRG